VQSDDGGETWFRPDEGLQQHYLWCAAADPSITVISAELGPQQAHNPTQAFSTLYHLSPWQLLQDGLPMLEGTLASATAVNRAEVGVFYIANNRGVFRSTDAGRTWERLSIAGLVALQGNRPLTLVAISEA
jgi:photosystem II stability/assembly factor-like uncharacterized protein